MKIFLKLFGIILLCFVIVGAVYVWRFGWPEFLKKEDNFLNSVFNYCITYVGEQSDGNITVSLEQEKIIFIKKLDENTEEKIIFEYSNDAIKTAINEQQIEESFSKYAISCIFEAVSVLNEQDVENARYSLIPDIITGKTLEQDGYQLTSNNNVTRFLVATNKKLNLAESHEVYIKVSDLENIEDILKNKLQYRLVEKPGIVLEKNISYSRNLVFVIYENEMLTDRTYNSLMTLLNVIAKDSSFVEYVKKNYPTITQEGTLTLKGITISLNENLGDGNIYYYENPENYKYMLVRINIDKVVE